MEWANAITIFTSSSIVHHLICQLNYWKLLDDVLKCFCASCTKLFNVVCIIDEYGQTICFVIVEIWILLCLCTKLYLWAVKGILSGILEIVLRECNTVWLIVCSASLGGFCYCCWLFDWPVIGWIWSILLLIGRPYFPFLRFSLFRGCLWAGSKTEFVFPLFAGVIRGAILNFGGQVKCFTSWLIASCVCFGFVLLEFLGVVLALFLFGLWQYCFSLPSLFKVCLVLCSLCF